MPHPHRTDGARPTVAAHEAPYVTEHQVNLLWELLRSTGLEESSEPEDAQALLEAAHARLRDAGAFGTLQARGSDVESLDVFLTWWTGTEVPA